jgi:hypothetical protein
VGGDIVPAMVVDSSRIALDLQICLSSQPDGKKEAAREGS